MKDIPQQESLPGVPQAKQGRNVPPSWEWTEANVWTERMLETLVRGIKGDRCYSLIWVMSNVKEIETAITKLPLEAAEEVRDWLEEFIEDQLEVSDEFKAKTQRAKEEIATVVRVSEGETVGGHADHDRLGVPHGVDASNGSRYWLTG